ncbi:hypothetical protein [Methylobacterium sp. E-016]|uniref:hypothetical protein n=1 Tax=Methylobacterium sp. E-016 TaxID=2836556 RepID=UPI001FBB6008|nr:hypothetical protein [Methylobacterium sp. E-016]
MRPLNDFERSILKALTDEFVSASVVKARARIAMKDLIGPTVEACLELEKRGLAERMGRPTRVAWRRANGVIKDA